MPGIQRNMTDPPPFGFAGVQLPDARLKGMTYDEAYDLFQLRPLLPIAPDIDEEQYTEADMQELKAFCWVLADGSAEIPRH